MTQAFNLSQFANKVNTSGQADLTTAVTGVLPTANGGTGLSSPGASGNVLRSNGSVWTSAALADYAGNKGQVFDTGAVFTASKSTTVLNVTAVQKGTLYVGQTIFYNNATMTINSFGTGSGGTGTYNVSVSGTVASRPWSGSGTGTFTIPVGITALKVTVIGGGGAGGNSGTQNMGSGGGGGGAAIKYLTGLTPGATISVVCGYASGTSSVSSGTQAISTISATGGASGTSSGFPNNNTTGANGGLGGIGSGGDLNLQGGSGGAVIGSQSSGCTYSDSWFNIQNFGGISMLSGGARQGNGLTVSGVTMLSGGGGGSGAISQDSTTRYGGMGSPGVVIIEW